MCRFDELFSGFPKVLSHSCLFSWLVIEMSIETNEESVQSRRSRRMWGSEVTAVHRSLSLAFSRAPCGPACPNPLTTPPHPPLLTAALRPDYKISPLWSGLIPKLQNPQDAVTPTGIKRHSQPTSLRAAGSVTHWPTRPPEGFHSLNSLSVNKLNSANKKRLFKLCVQQLLATCKMRHLLFKMIKT